MEPVAVSTARVLEKKPMQLAAEEKFETKSTLERMQPANPVAVANRVMWQ